MFYTVCSATFGDCESSVSVPHALYSPIVVLLLCEPDFRTIIQEVIYAVATGGLPYQAAADFLKCDEVQSVVGAQLTIVDTLYFADVDATRGLLQSK